MQVRRQAKRRYAMLRRWVGYQSRDVYVLGTNSPATAHVNVTGYQGDTVAGVPWSFGQIAEVS